MAVAYRSISTSGPTLSGTSHVTNAPSGVVNNDVLVLRVMIMPPSFSGSAAGFTVTPPAGFTLRNRTDWDPGWHATGASQLIFTKLAASEGASYTTNFGSAVYVDADITAFSGADASSGSAHFDTIAAATGTGTSAGTSLTVARADSALHFTTCSSVGATSAAPTGFTQRANYDTNVYTATKDPQAAGATGTIAATYPTSQNWVVQLISIQPASGGGGGGTQLVRRTGAVAESAPADERLARRPNVRPTSVDMPALSMWGVMPDSAPDTEMPPQRRRMILPSGAAPLNTFIPRRAAVVAARDHAEQPLARVIRWGVPSGAAPEPAPAFPRLGRVGYEALSELEARISARGLPLLTPEPVASRAYARVARVRNESPAMERIARLGMPNLWVDPDPPDPPTAADNRSTAGGRGRGRGRR